MSAYCVYNVEAGLPGHVDGEEMLAKPPGRSRPTFTDQEVANLVGTSLYEEAAPGSFSSYFTLVQSNSRLGSGGYEWKEEAA